MPEGRRVTATENGDHFGFFLSRRVHRKTFPQSLVHLCCLRIIWRMASLSVQLTKFMFWTVPCAEIELIFVCKGLNWITTENATFANELIEWNQNGDTSPGNLCQELITFITCYSNPFNLHFSNLPHVRFIFINFHVLTIFLLNKRRIFNAQIP